MEKNTLLLRDTEAFMRGELDNVTVSGGRIVLDMAQGAYVPCGCYTSAPLPMPLFDALRVSWNAVCPPETAVEAQARVLVDGNWSMWVGFGKWSPHLPRVSPPPAERGPLRRLPDQLRLDSKYATQVQLRIYLYTQKEKLTPAVELLGASVRAVDVIPAHGRPLNTRLHLMPYAQAGRAEALRPCMDVAIGLASMANRWGADLLPEEFAQLMLDRRPEDGLDRRNLSYAAAAAAHWGFPTWVCFADLAVLRDEARHGYGAAVALQATPAQLAQGLPEQRFVTVRGFAAMDGEPQVLLCDPYAGPGDFDAETAMPLDDFLVAWDNVALLMRPRDVQVPVRRTRSGVWVRPVPDEPGLYRLYQNGELRALPDDWCETGGLLAWTTPDPRPHATTAHRHFHFVSPENGGIRLPVADDGELHRYTVYAIATDAHMLVGDVTV